MPQKDICVIFNPQAGRGRAAGHLERLRQELAARADFQPTCRPGHAEELASLAAKAGFSIVAAAGGDGTVHEVANGLLNSGPTEPALAVFPIGSANDYAYALAIDSAWALPLMGEGPARAVDVGYVRAPDGRSRYFVNGLGLGFNGAVTLESRRIRRLRGLPLYAAALLRALWHHYACPRMAVTIDGTLRETPTLALSMNIGRREGNFPLTPQAQLDDGLFDFLHAGALPRWQLLRYLPRMILGRLPADHPALRMGRCRAVSLCSEAPLTVHVDGEFFSRPEDEVRALTIELLPRRLRVQLFRSWKF
jgi:diacylglycerol kinase family enzyme